MLIAAHKQTYKMRNTMNKTLAICSILFSCIAYAGNSASKKNTVTEFIKSGESFLVSAHNNSDVKVKCEREITLLHDDGRVCSCGLGSDGYRELILDIPDSIQGKVLATGLEADKCNDMAAYDPRCR